MATTILEKSIKEVAKAIKVIDNNSFQAEYLKNGKEKINEARKLLYDVLSANGYALKPNGSAYKLKQMKVVPMTTKKMEEIFEENEFFVSLIKENGVQCADLQTFTTEGVPMFFRLSPFSIEAFEKVVDKLNLDKDIENHVDLDLSISTMVKDFDEYHDKLKRILSELKGF